MADAEVQQANADPAGDPGAGEAPTEHRISVELAVKMDTPYGLRRGACSCGWRGGTDSPKGALAAATNHKRSKETPPEPQTYTGKELADDAVLQALRKASHALDYAGSMASNVGDYGWANRLWELQSLIDNRRRMARDDGKRFLGQLPGRNGRSDAPHRGAGEDAPGEDRGVQH